MALTEQWTPHVRGMESHKYWWMQKLERNTEYVVEVSGVVNGMSGVDEWKV